MFGSYVYPEAIPRSQTDKTITQEL